MLTHNDVVVSSRFTEEQAHDPDFLTKLRTSRPTTATVGLNTTESLTDVCLDSGCSGSIINEAFAETIPDIDIRSCRPIGIKGIGSKHKAIRYGVFRVNFPSVDPSPAPGAPSFARITVRAQLVPEMRPNLLIGNDVMRREGMLLDPEYTVGAIRSCNNFVFSVRCNAEDQLVHL
ncbi:hypothetical protein BP00DRAFT_355507, partial [Aspergillus indologenus CBS 114.80]